MPGTVKWHAALAFFDIDRSIQTQRAIDDAALTTIGTPHYHQEDRSEHEAPSELPEYLNKWYANKGREIKSDFG